MKLIVNANSPSCETFVCKAERIVPCAEIIDGDAVPYFVLQFKSWASAPDVDTFLGFCDSHHIAVRCGLCSSLSRSLYFAFDDPSDYEIVS